MVAAWIPENPAFHICCVLSGIIGVQGSLLHASVYVLHAVIHHELAVDWSIGKAHAERQRKGEGARRDDEG